jgi:hypothetical protein
LSYLNAQGQPKYDWPPSFELMHAYLDQLEREREHDFGFIQSIREGLEEAGQASGAEKSLLLNQLARRLEVKANGSTNKSKTRILARTMKAMSSRI